MKRYIVTAVFFIVFITVIGFRYSQDIKNEAKEIKEISLLFKYEAGEGEKTSVSKSNTYFAALKDGNIYYYDKGRVQWNKKISESLVGIQISDNGDRIAAWESNKIYFLDKYGSILWSVERKENINSVIISPDSSYLLGVLENKLQFISASVIALNRIFEERNIGLIEKIFISEDGSSVGILTSVRAPQYLAEGQYLGSRVSSKIYLFDKNGKLKWQKGMPNEYVTSISVSDKGKYFVAGTSHLLEAYSTEKPLYIFDENGELVFSFNARDGFLGVSFSRDSNYIAAGSRDGNVYLFGKDVRGWTYLWNYSIGGWGDWTRPVSLSEKYYFAIWSNGYIHIIDKNGKLIWKYNTGTMPLLWIKTLSISQDGSYIWLSGYRGGEHEEIYLFKVEK